jgi:flagellar basal body-associated protein FliL
MADADDKIKEQEEQKEPQAEQTGKKSLIGRLLPWIVMAVVVVFCAGAGFGLGRLFAGSGTPKAAPSDSKPHEPVQTKDLAAHDSAKETNKVWYYDLDPVVANLNEPSATRYVRAALTLEMSPEVDKDKGKVFLDEKKPILISWLTVYLSGLKLEDLRGDKNLKSIQSHVREAFNEKLFPDSKSQISQVLLKEFAVQ